MTNQQHPITPPPERQLSFAELLMPIPKAQVESQPSGDHSITPSPELIAKWASQAVEAANCSADVTVSVATQAAQWGADQQLAEDAEWLDHNALNEPHLKIIPMGESLKEAMRPKPPSLKYQALKSLGHINRGIDRPEDTDIIRRALEQLPE